MNTHDLRSTHRCFIHGTKKFIIRLIGASLCGLLSLAAPYRLRVAEAESYLLWTASPTIPEACIVTTNDGFYTPGSLSFALNQTSCCETIIFTSTVSTIELDGYELYVSAECTGLTIDGTGGASGRVTISGSQKARVMTIAEGATVTLKNLTITQGRATSKAGIWNKGTLTVDSTTIITQNESTDSSLGGGGICNDGTLTLNGTVANNRSAGYGGGIANNLSSALLTLNGTVSNNTASNLGGGVNNWGTLILNGTVSNNIAGLSGGGVMNYKTLTLNGTVNGNTATLYGGGGVNNTGDLTVNGIISGNTAKTGGGVSNNNNGVFYLNASGKITGNTATAEGGGIYNYDGDLFIMNRATVAIADNTASGTGGGVYNSFGSVTGATSATIKNNTAGTCNNYYDYQTTTPCVLP